MLYAYKLMFAVGLIMETRMSNFLMTVLGFVYVITEFLFSLDNSSKLSGFKKSRGVRKILRIHIVFELNVLALFLNGIALHPKTK